MYVMLWGFPFSISVFQVGKGKRVKCEEVCIIAYACTDGYFFTFIILCNIWRATIDASGHIIPAEVLPDTHH